ncbi:MAG: lysoplasmalogenase [Bacteroidetes bacterium]|nr:lysoplasmalogenase [Bacteroidota bacterium]
MNVRNKSVLFFLILASNIGASLFGWDWGEYLTKPLLVPLLGWLLVGSKWIRVKWIWFALFFSWVGDIVLMLPIDGFVLGLGSFLLAHLFYIRHFWGIWDRSRISFKPLYLVGVVGYLSGLILLLFPLLGSLQLPVIAYGLVISTMLLLALHAGSIGYQWGAAFFVLSDSILAINKFHTPLPVSALWVMGTYGWAQYRIVFSSRTEKFG